MLELADERRLQTPSDTRESDQRRVPDDREDVRCEIHYRSTSIYTPTAMRTIGTKNGCVASGRWRPITSAAATSAGRPAGTSRPPGSPRERYTIAIAIASEPREVGAAASANAGTQVGMSRAKPKPMSAAAGTM